MANDVYATVAQYTSCVRNGMQWKHKRPLQLFPSCGPLESVAMDILALLSRSTTGNQQVIGMTDRYFEISESSTNCKDKCNAGGEHLFGLLDHFVWNTK